MLCHEDVKRNCLRCKKRAKAHTPRRAAIPGFLIDVPPRRFWRGRLLRLSAFICGSNTQRAETAEGSRRGESGRHGGLPLLPLGRDILHSQGGAHSDRGS